MCLPRPSGQPEDRPSHLIYPRRLSKFSGFRVTSDPRGRWGAAMVTTTPDETQQWIGLLATVRREKASPDVSFWNEFRSWVGNNPDQRRHMRPKRTYPIVLAAGLAGRHRARGDDQDARRVCAAGTFAARDDRQPSTHSN